MSSVAYTDDDLHSQSEDGVERKQAEQQEPDETARPKPLKFDRAKWLTTLDEIRQFVSVETDVKFNRDMADQRARLTKGRRMPAEFLQDYRFYIEEFITKHLKAMVTSREKGTLDAVKADIGMWVFRQQQHVQDWMVSKTTNINKDTYSSQKEYTKAVKLWLAMFKDLNSKSGEMGLSVMDHLFVLICFLETGKDPKRLSIDVNAVNDNLYGQMLLLAARHSPLTRNRNIPIMERHQLFAAIAALVVRRRGYTPTAKEIEKPTIYTDPMLKRAVDELYIQPPPATIDATEDNPDGYLSNEDEFDESETSVSQQVDIGPGMLRSMPTCHLQMLVPFYSQVFRNLTMDDKLEDLFETTLPTDVGAINQSNVDAMRKWYVNRSKLMNGYHEDSTFLPTFTELVWASVCPRGFNDAAARSSKITDEKRPLELFNQFWGYDTMNGIKDMMEGPVDGIVSNPDHIAYPYLFLCYVHYHMKSAYKHDFLQAHHADQTDFIPLLHHLVRMKPGDWIGYRLPVFRKVHTYWYIWDQQVKHKFDSFETMILTFFLIIKKRYYGRLSNHISISTFIDKFFPDS